MTTNSNPEYFEKKSSYHEYSLHQLIFWASRVVHEKVHVPRVVAFDSTSEILSMEYIPNMCIADQFGEDWSEIPSGIKQDIKRIVKTLFAMGYVYPDITGYNFILFDGEVYVIDFEHAFIYTGTRSDLSAVQSDYFDYVTKFIEDETLALGWNPDFR